MIEANHDLPYRSKTRVKHIYVVMMDIILALVDLSLNLWIISNQFQLIKYLDYFGNQLKRGPISAI
jgi:hypothetical protein